MVLWDNNGKFNTLHYIIILQLSSEELQSFLYKITVMYFILQTQRIEN